MENVLRRACGVIPSSEEQVVGLQEMLICG
jgi:hypothetical protein